MQMVGFDLIEKKITKATEYAIAMLTSDIMKDSNVFIPLIQGHLRDSAITHTAGVSGLIIWGAEYAARLYYGVDFNFTLTENPLASPLWFEVAKNYFGDTWNEKFNGYFNEYLRNN